MPAGIEERDTAFFSHEAAWHGLGVVINRDVPIREAAEVAGLTWEVGKARARLSFLNVYQTSPTVDRGLAYGLFNAATEWFDYGRQERASQTKTNADKKVDAIWFGQGIDFKSEAVKVIAGV